MTRLSPARAATLRALLHGHVRREPATRQQLQFHYAHPPVTPAHVAEALDALTALGVLAVARGVYTATPEDA